MMLDPVLVTVTEALSINRTGCGLQRYGLGQYWMDPRDAFEPSVAAHLRNGVPEPAGTPMTDPGPPIEWGPPSGPPAPR